MAFDYTKVDMAAIMARTYDAMSPKQREGTALAAKVGKENKIGKIAAGFIYDVWMGVGKTFMGLTSALMYKPQTILIICSKNALGTWQAEIEKWYPEFSDPNLFAHVRGTADKRQTIYLKSKQPNGPLFLIVIGGSFIRDIDFLIANKIHFDAIIVDEAHKVGLRNRKSLGFLAVKAIVDKNYWPVKVIGIMTGSLTSKGPKHLWSYLNIIAPHIFRSYWGFVSTYTHTFDGPFGKITGGPKNQEGLAIVTSPYIFRVSEKEAAAELPPLRRIILPTELEPNIAKMYNSLANELYMELETDAGRELITTGTILGAYTKLRQLITCPATFDPSLGAGTPIEAVCDKILESDELPHFKHNIIFTPYLPSIPFFHDYIATTLKMSKSDVLVLQGGDEPDYLNKVENIFRKNHETAVLCSLKFAQSFNLETCMNVYFPHFEWDQDDNKQAEARGRRKTSDKSRTILSYYVNVKGTITNDMLAILNEKEVNNVRTYSFFQQLKERLRKPVMGSD